METQTVIPALLTVAAAAKYCGCSASYLNTERAADAKRLARGEPIKGPAWLRCPYGIRYRVDALDEWIKRTAVEGGVMESRRRSVNEAESQEN